MPPPEGKAGSLCIYLLSGLFFLVLAAGGALLIIYFVSPESESTIWFPIAGMVLVAIPWLFWIMTCLYRSIASRQSPSVERAPVRAAAVAPAMVGASTTSAAEDSQVFSPGGARRVRFGTTTVIGSQDANGEAAIAAAGGAGGTTSKPHHEGDGDSHATTASTVSNEEGSLNSHESEMPLAFAMS